MADEVPTGKPPTTADARLASPSPISSWLESCRVLSLVSTATAESSESIDPMSAITRRSSKGPGDARGGSARSPRIGASAAAERRGRPVTPRRAADPTRRRAMRAPRPHTPACRQRSRSAPMGNRGQRRATNQQSAKVATPSARPRPSRGAGRRRAPATPPPCASPRNVSTCAITMSSARPFMKPATTGSGTKLTSVPKRRSAKSTCSSPETATHSAAGTAATPYRHPARDEPRIGREDGDKGGEDDGGRGLGSGTRRVGATDERRDQAPGDGRGKGGRNADRRRRRAERRERQEAERQQDAERHDRARQSAAKSAASAGADAAGGVPSCRSRLSSGMCCSHGCAHLKRMRSRLGGSRVMRLPLSKARRRAEHRGGKADGGAAFQVTYASRRCPQQEFVLRPHVRLSFPDLMLVLAVVTVWGFAFVPMRWALDTVPPFALAALRFLCAAVPAVFFVRRPDWRGHAGRLRLRDRRLPVRPAVPRDALGMPAGLSSLVIQLQAFFTILLAAWWLHDRLTLHSIVGAVDRGDRHRGARRAQGDGRCRRHGDRLRAS